MTDQIVPLLDLQAQYRQLRREIDDAVARVIQRGWFVLGEEVEAFEAEFAGYCRVGHGVGVGSGTEALHLGLLSLGVAQGTEVIAPANTSLATISAICLAGGRPVLADVHEACATLDPAAVERALSPRTAAVVAVHLYGQCAAVGALRELCAKRGVPILEDAAQAHGACENGRPAGGLGEVAAFSFYPSKNLGAYGDGGMVTTQDRALADRVRRLRNYGQDERDRAIEIGYNSRLDELQAAILRVKLPHLDSWNERRRALTQRYQDQLSAFPIVWNEEVRNRHHVRHLCVARIRDRDRFRSFLQSKGIQTGVHYPIPIHLQKAYAYLGHRSGDFPVTEGLASSLVSLPLYPEMSDEVQDRVIEAVRAWFRKDD